MTGEKRIAFEKYYRELWLKQLLIDRKHNPLCEAPKTRQPRSSDDDETRKKLKLSVQAEIINRLLRKKMLGREIADILGITQQAVSDTKKRYSLPRTDEEIATENQPEGEYDADFQSV